MPEHVFSIAPLLPAIQSNALILTPNSRMRRKLQQAYNLHCLDAGASVCLAPRLYSLADWTEETYQRLLDAAALPQPKIIASDSQQQALWQQVINSDSSSSALINPVCLANDAAAAYRSLLRWQLSTADMAEFESQGNTDLAGWIDHFEQLLERLQLCLPEHAQQAIMAALQEGILGPEQQLLVLGFEDTPPQLQALFHSLCEQPAFVAAISRPSAADSGLVKCVDQEAEVRTAASWALALLQQDSNAAIGIIAPNLGQSRALIERIFIETFEPHYNLPQTERYTLPFNFSAGVPLGGVPLIRDTLQLLKLNASRWPVADLLALLNSPFWGPEQQLDVLQALAQALRQSGREFTSTGQLRRHCHRLQEDRLAADESSESDSPEYGDCSYGDWLDKALQGVESLRRQHPRQAIPSQWAALFEQQLRQLQWPGNRRLDSNEFQQMNQWYQLMEEFVRFDVSLGQLDYAGAIDLLGQLAMSTHFQAQTPDSPIQILGILEAAGLEFSHCWVLGMAQKDWPPAAQPNPLLPLTLQRQYGMPHADACRELVYAQRLTHNYRRCADQVRFSFASQQDDSEQMPSPLLADLALLDLPLAQQSGSEWRQYINLIARHSDLQWLNINAAPAVEQQELAQLRGGTGILKHQAILPAAAFLLYRLNADPDRRISNGLTPLQRGQLLHDSLADIWQQLGSQRALLAMDDDQLQQLLRSAIDPHIQALRRREPTLLGSNYLAMEAERQASLILQWLELEKSRPDFTVRAVEKALDIEFEGIPLRLRLDRVDQLHNGEQLLIDYKSGTVAARQWAGERPEEPQLPLYSLCYDERIDAIMFAGINARQVQMIGLGGLSVAHEGFLSSEEKEKLELPAEWSQIMHHWREVLQNLARGFLQGDCSLEIKAANLRRNYEFLAPLLRWQEQQEIDTRLMQLAERAE